MPAPKIVLDEVFEEPFVLFAIHSSLEDYRLAYVLNRQLGLRLTRCRKDVDLQEKGTKSLFPLYSFENLQMYCHFYLVSNVSRTRISSEERMDSLFGKEESFKKAFLLPEFSTVDFLLKVEGDFPPENEADLLPKIKEIAQVSTAYIIGDHKIKSKENLIFD